MNPLRARYIGYTKGTENHGDEALLWIIRDLLAPEIDVVSSGAEYDLALLGGGTLINQSPWLIDFFSATLDKAGRGVVFGTGVGDLAFWGNHFERWAPLLNRCDLVGVRGPDSVALLHQHGVSHAVCVGDPYLWLRCPMEREPIPRRLGVNLGGTNNSLWGTNDGDLHEYLVDVLRALKARGWSFVWVSVWSQDLPMIEAVRARVDPASAPVLDARAQSLEAYSAIAGCEVFLGEKLHGNAMAAIAGVPFLGLEYQPKVRDFAASLDVAEWIVSTAERNRDALVERIERLRHRRETVRQQMVGAREALRDRLAAFTAAVKQHYAPVGAGAILDLDAGRPDLAPPESLPSESAGFGG